MDAYYIMAGISILIIFSYFFDAIARKTKFPSVILLIMLGVGLRVAADYIDFHIPAYFERTVIPLFGTIGLILIVLEGALELHVDKSKKNVIIRGFLSAFFILIFTALALAYLLNAWKGVPFLEAMLEVTPLAIISSAVAIPSAAGLLKQDKEFVVFESTFSDILGIVLFYFLKGHLVNESLNPPMPFFVPKEVDMVSFVNLFIEIGLVVVISLIVSFLLMELIEKISHNVKFFLILALLILAYVVAKKFHLSALIIVFFFGLFMSNPRTLIPKFFRKYLKINKVEEGLHEFHILTAESTFLIRTGFFLFFGFSITLDMFTEMDTYIYGFAVLGLIAAVRFFYLGITQPKNVVPLSFISPRGLITILLFMDLPDDFHNAIINEKVLLIVILGSMLLMLFGLLVFGGKGQKGEKAVDLESFGDVIEPGVREKS